MLLCANDSGLCYIDTRSGEVIRRQVTNHPCFKVCILNQEDPNLFAGIGYELLQYDTRCFSDNRDAKPKAIAQWSLPANVTALDCISTRKNHLLVGVGCENGKVAAFDTS